MGWTGQYVGGNFTNKDKMNFLKNEFAVGVEIKKSVCKGSNFYFLCERDGKQYVYIYLTSMNQGEFLFKSFCLNPCEKSFDVPVTILKDFKPSSDEDASWLKEQLLNKKSSFKIMIGDILDCTAKSSVDWGNDIHLEEGSTVKVGVFKKWNTKNGMEFFLVDSNGNKSRYRLSRKVLNECFEIKR